MESSRGATHEARKQYIAPMELTIGELFSIHNAAPNGAFHDFIFKN